MKNDKLGDTMKAYEREFSPQLDPYAGPIIVRLDGRAFHTFTKGLNRPYDERLAECMWQTTAFCLEQTHAKVAYTQSDEISLLFDYEEPSQPIFGGKLNKINSILASMATAEFNLSLHDRLPEKSSQRAQFDCRTFQVPDRTTATNVFLWRFLDAQRNAVSMAAQAHYSHRELQGKSVGDMLGMLREADVRFDDYPRWFRYGAFFFRKRAEMSLAKKELAKIPEKHRPTGPVMRTKVVRASLCFAEVNNQEGFLFDGRHIKA